MRIAIALLALAATGAAPMPPGHRHPARCRHLAHGGAVRAGDPARDFRHVAA